MGANPYPNPKFRAFDSSGNPLSGGKLYTYAAGTTTPQTTYTTSAGDIANANPIILDANGYANVWLTPGIDYKFELQNSSGAVQWTEDNIPSPVQDTTVQSAIVAPGHRLTLTSGTPVTTGDVTAASTVYYVAFKGQQVPLYDATNDIYVLHGPGNLSNSLGDATKSPAAAVANKNYDLFVWYDNGTYRLSRGPPWSSDTSRGTGTGTSELVNGSGFMLNAVAISNGPAAGQGLYVGTIHTDDNAQVNDSMAKRHVWNQYNRVMRPMRVVESTDYWTYETATWRQANGATANQLDYVQGLAEDGICAQVVASGGNNSSSAFVAVAVGVDSTTTPSGLFGPSGGSSDNEPTLCVASYRGIPGLGRHTLVWLEYAEAISGAYFIGDNGTAYAQSGIQGEIFA